MNRKRQAGAASTLIASTVAVAAIVTLAGVPMIQGILAERSLVEDLTQASEAVAMHSGGRAEVSLKAYERGPFTSRGTVSVGERGGEQADFEIDILHGYTGVHFEIRPSAEGETAALLNQFGASAEALRLEGYSGLLDDRGALHVGVLDGSPEDSPASLLSEPLEARYRIGGGGDIDFSLDWGGLRVSDGRGRDLLQVVNLSARSSGERIADGHLWLGSTDWALERLAIDAEGERLLADGLSATAASRRAGEGMLDQDVQVHWEAIDYNGLRLRDLRVNTRTFDLPESAITQIARLSEAPGGGTPALSELKPALSDLVAASPQWRLRFSVNNADGDSAAGADASLGALADQAALIEQAQGPALLSVLPRVIEGSLRVRLGESLVAALPPQPRALIERSVAEGYLLEAEGGYTFEGRYGSNGLRLNGEPVDRP